MICLHIQLKSTSLTNIGVWVVREPVRPKGFELEAFIPVLDEDFNKLVIDCGLMGGICFDPSGYILAHCLFTNTSLPQLLPMICSPPEGEESSPHLLNSKLNFLLKLLSLGNGFAPFNTYNPLQSGIVDSSVFLK